MEHPLCFGVGILGNIISCLVFLAPLPTFYRIYRKKSTDGFESLPYVAALFSSMIWIYYAFLKKENVVLLITINSVGCFMQSSYIMMYLVYAPRSAKVYTAKLISLLNIGVYGLIVLVTMMSSNGSKRVAIVGWICVGCSACVFLAPLSIIRLVIETKSVQFMPFLLSLSLTVNACVWLAYGLLLKDKYVMLPNIVGIFFGVAQMIVYLVYKDGREIKVERKEPCHVVNIPKISVTSGPEVYPIDMSSDRGEEKADGVETKRKDGREEIELRHSDIV